MIVNGKLVFLATFFAFLVQSLYAFIDNADELIAIPYVLILGGAAAYFLSRNLKDPDQEFQLNIFFWAFSVRLWMSMVLYMWGMSAVFGDEDASGYASGWRFASNWWQNGLEGFVSDLATIFV